MLAVSPVAFGDDTFSFTFTSTATSPPTCCAVDEIVTGNLTGTEIGNTGDYQITSGAISFSGTFTGSGVIDTNTSDWGCCGADNILYVAGNGPTSVYLDSGGLLFSTTDGLKNLWGGDNNGYNNPTGTNYSISWSNNNYVDYPGTFATGTLSLGQGEVVAAPEPVVVAQLVVMLSAVLACAFLFGKKIA